MNNINDLNRTILRCPVCLDPLYRLSTSYQCRQIHSFDMSRSGYTNLLLPNEKRSPLPGDSKEMVHSRLHFLSKGYYEPIAKTLMDIFTEIQGTQPIDNIADVGCGTGYYLRYIANHLLQIQETECWGVDISKDAILLASKNTSSLISNIHWTIASSKKLPFCNHSLDIVYSIFAPLYEQEILRVLKPGGYLVCIVPSTLHLIELREQLFEKVLPIEKEGLFQKLEILFKPVASYSSCHTIQLNNQDDIFDLIRMTPYHWKAPAERLESLKKISQLEVTIDVKILVFQTTPEKES